MGDDSLGAPGFLMERVEGETIARKLLRDDEYAKARGVMTGQLGAIVAAYTCDPFGASSGLGLAAPAEGKSRAETEVDRFEQMYRLFTPEPHPAFELAFRWLRRNLPPAGGAGAGPRRLPHRQRHLRAGGRAGDSRLGACAYRRPDGGPGLALRALVALRERRQARRRARLARGALGSVRGWRAGARSTAKQCTGGRCSGTCAGASSASARRGVSSTGARRAAQGRGWSWRRSGGGRRRRSGSLLEMMGVS